MAHQGFNKYERTFGLLVFYRVKDRYYVRKKSQLSGKRVKTAIEFVNSMNSANRLKTASRIASTIYKQLPDSWKFFELYQKLTGIGARLLKEGKSITEIRPILEQQLYDWGYRKEVSYPIIKPSNIPILLRTPKECMLEDTRLKRQGSRIKDLDTRLKNKDNRFEKQNIRCKARNTGLFCIGAINTKLSALITLYSTYNGGKINGRLLRTIKKTPVIKGRLLTIDSS